jgi:hypothetical protein
MNIQHAAKLAESKDQYIQKYFGAMAKMGIPSTLAGDSTPILRFRGRDIDELMGIAEDAVKANYISKYNNYDTLQDAHDKMFLKIAGDTLFNPKTGIGTVADPSVYTRSNVPIMMGPFEESNVYASGGLPAIIIDKKSRAMTMQGATFKAYRDFWDNDKINMLEEAAATTGFNDHIADATAEDFIYGGSILYPVFDKDTPGKMLQDMEKSMKLEKGCIKRWVNVDRWNLTIVPSYIVTAEDYLHPKTIYIPQSSLEIHTSRVAFLKPKPMPYWVYLLNLGWCPSDMCGWMRAYYGYEITCQSIPVMAQQMSLLLYRMPLDALNATLGVEKVKELMKINVEKMADWSAVSPKAVNMVGEVEVVDRTYTGIEQLMGTMKSDLASQTGLPEPSLWHTPNKGFSDNTQESLLKQSETLRMSQTCLERSMKPCTDALIAHVFGKDSEEWANRDYVKMTFNKPVISTEKDLAEVGARFAASVSSFCQAGVSPDIALKLSSQFFPTVKITQEMLDMAKKSYEEALDKKEKMGAGQGNTMASSGAGKTTGSFTKPK